MTVKTLTVLACEKPDCREQIEARAGESPYLLRRRANREHGWRTVPSFNAGSHTDLCRWHS
jgi:hypothetical protein